MGARAAAGSWEVRASGPIARGLINVSDALRAAQQDATTDRLTHLMNRLIGPPAPLQRARERRSRPGRSLRVKLGVTQATPVALASATSTTPTSSPAKRLRRQATRTTDATTANHSTPTWKTGCPA